MKIAVLVSGGVDSSVALKLLKDQGHDLTAFYLKIWLEDELSHLGNCPWEEDLGYARAVCKKLRVPLQVVSLQDEYWNKVVSYTIAHVKAGRTPSPDLLCNQQIKMGAFYEKIGNEFDKVATGHYAQVEERDRVFLLKKSPDPIKDQTYFLSSLNQKQLSKALFPIGHLIKIQVRELADKFDLPNKDRKDSQGICFLGKIKFSEFIKHHLGQKEGDLVEFETGLKVGTHQGFWYHTIGQRKGLGLSGGPWFVVSKDPEKNIVYVSNKYFTSEKKRNKFTVSRFNWIVPGTDFKQVCSVKVRHGESSYSCQISMTGPDCGIVRIDGNDQGLAPGQFAVFYDGDICLGCATITENKPSKNLTTS